VIGWGEGANADRGRWRSGDGGGRGEEESGSGRCGGLEGLEGLESEGAGVSLGEPCRLRQRSGLGWF
jgi:hypothetical protein